MKRLFIGLKTNQKIEEKILNWQNDKLDWPVRFIPPKNLHLTLVPPWPSSQVPLIIDKLSKIKIDNKVIDIEYKLIDYGPSPKNYRLIWALGNYSLELNNLKNKIADQLAIKKSSRKFLPHLTLARFKKLAIKNVKEEISWHDSYKEFILFESILKPEGVEYNIIKKFKL